MHKTGGRLTRNGRPFFYVNAFFFVSTRTARRARRIAGV
jgi:hypothetical protein